VRVVLTDEAIEVRLSLWEKVLGLLGDIVVPRGDVSDARVVEAPMKEAIRSGLKVGLRLPGVIYVARTITLDRALLVRRRMPGLEFAVANRRFLRSVLVTTPDAAEIAARLGGG
jgi:hypothetical protein